MMGKLPDERFPSVADAIASLSAALDGSSVPRQPQPQPAAVAAASGAFSRPMPPSTKALPWQWLAGLAAALLATVGAAVLVIVVAMARRTAPDATAALSLWKSGRYTEAAAQLRALLDATPGLEEDASVVSTLSASVDDHEAEEQLDDLMTRTALGRSDAMANSLADLAIHAEEGRRDPALQLLRDRHARLTPEKRYRVELRDADDCDAVARAQSSLAAAGTGGASEDLSRVRGRDCKRILRRGKLCDECRPGAPGGNGSGGKGQGKGRGRKNKDDKDDD
jgi:hypothetical protein